MRSPSRLIIPASVLAASLVLAPLSARAQAPRSEGAAAAPAAARAAQATAARSGRVAVLPTGERVRLTATGGREQVMVSHRAASGPGRTMMVRRLGDKTYVFPATVERYLGRGIDRSLFDVDTLPALQTRNRLPLRLSFSDAVRSVPGVTITSKGTKTARGYLTRSGSDAFGKALARQWLADRSSPLPGVTSISLDVPRPAKVKAAYVMHTLIIKVTGSDGQPQADGEVAVLNVDNGNRYADYAYVYDGEARISVPAGHYSLIGDEFLYDEDTETGSIRVTTVDPYTVSGSDQTVEIDQRTATVHPQVHTPKPAGLTDYIPELDRVDAKDEFGFGSGYIADAGIDVAFSPVAPATRGTFAFEQAWSLDSAAGVSPRYHYDLADLDDHIGTTEDSTFTPGQLATVNASYYGDGSTSPAGSGRTALFEDAGGFGVFDQIARGTARTEYVGASGGDAIWTESALVNWDSADDPGFFDGPFDEIPAGSTRTTDWFRGPIVAGIPDQGKYGFCYGCRSNTRLSVIVPPINDTDPTHSGEIFGAEDGLPVARFRLYRGHTLVSDHDDYIGAEAKVSKKKALYTAKLDVDRRLVDPVQSTQTRTVYKFTSKAGTGKKLSKHWVCAESSCRVLPLVQAHVLLPTDLQGRLPAGKTAVTVRVARIEGATPSAAKSAALAYRPAGFPWASVKLTNNGDGTFTGLVDNTDLEGSLVDLRVRGTDRGGSTFSQTIVRAYTVASA